MQKLNKLNTFALTLLITGAIDSIRNLPAAALFGSTMVFFFVFAAIIFLIPTALVSAELTANVAEGGIYQWSRAAFGERIAFLAIWLQWINNLVWFPTILSFIAGTAAYLINPALASSKTYMVSMVLALFWFLTIINLRGVRTSAKFTSFCTIAGLIIPMIFIITLLFTWLAAGHPVQIHLTASSIFPSLHQNENWMALTAIMLSFTGMELAAVHIKDVHNPKSTFPKALAISSLIILATMMLGSLAIAYVLPMDKINLVNGTIETFAYFLSAYHLSWLTPVMAILLVIGSMGGVISWVISPVKGVSQAAEQGFFPACLQHKNKYGVAQNLLLTQAMIVSVVCLAFIFLPSINASYWFLSALTTSLYMLMYVIMFLSAFRLRQTKHYQSNTFVIPGGKIGSSIVCLLGLFACLVTVIVGFIPPSNIDFGGPWHYQLYCLVGILLMMSPLAFFYWYQAKKQISAVLVPIANIA